MMLSDFRYALLHKVQGVHSLTMLETPSLRPWSGNAANIFTYHERPESAPHGHGPTIAAKVFVPLLLLTVCSRSDA